MSSTLSTLRVKSVPDLVTCTTWYGSVRKRSFFDAASKKYRTGVRTKLGSAVPLCKGLSQSLSAAWHHSVHVSRAALGEGAWPEMAFCGTTSQVNMKAATLFVDGISKIVRLRYGHPVPTGQSRRVVKLKRFLSEFDRHRRLRYL